MSLLTKTSQDTILEYLIPSHILNFYFIVISPHFLLLRSKTSAPPGLNIWVAQVQQQKQCDQHKGTSAHSVTRATSWVNQAAHPAKHLFFFFHPSRYHFPNHHHQMSNNPITQVSQHSMPAMGLQPQLLTRLHLDLRGARFTVDRETIMNLPESVLLCLFPNGLVLSRQSMALSENGEEEDDEVYGVDVRNAPSEEKCSLVAKNSQILFC